MTPHLGEPKVHSVSFDWSHDPFGEPDYLERSPADHFGDGWNHVSERDKAQVVAEHGSIWEACERYAREDAQRLRDFRVGEWWFESCRAIAEVRYEITPGTFRIERLCSPGLHGIESDCGEEYRREIEIEQLIELSQHLDRFGIAGADIGNISNLAGENIPQTRSGTM